MRGARGAPLTISRRDGARRGVVVLRLVGDLVLGSCEALREAVEAELVDGAERVIVDLTEATHVDMPGFALFVELHDRCLETEAELVVAALPESFRWSADALRLSRAVTMTDDVEATLDPTA